VLPDAEECISYSMPAFRHEGQVVAGFLATAKGCSYYPFSGTTLTTLADLLEGYPRTKSALHFDARQPLSATLVRKLLAARIAEAKTPAGTALRASAATPSSEKASPRRRSATRGRGQTRKA
jgi:uncharacterized protein YdhG (YjbR/CyaY superfamily)